jgi:hypothetical protein
MPLVCIQCAMRALLDGEPPPTFDDTTEEHMRKYHPDPEATQRERRAMEAELTARFAKGDLPR